MQVSALSDVGLVRRKNEDSYILLPNLGGGYGLILADGMGGHSKGEVASSVAVTFAAKKMQDRLHAHLSFKEIARRMADIVEHANVTVYVESLYSPQNTGMGTTLTLAYIKENEIILSHVGDCRAYRLERGGGLERLTTDHTFGQELVDQGEITPEEATRHEGRHMLTRALGVADYIYADVYAYKLQPGDRILLCTDGLYGYSGENEIYEILKQAEDPESCVQDLVRRANENGGGDNITVIAAFL